ncbi:AAA family ATPase [Candidatus Dependentiae bacterium]|nr:AAA family ATPase [Candidatus Dependentiae bacterium]
MFYKMVLLFTFNVITTLSMDLEFNDPFLPSGLQPTQSSERHRGKIPPHELAILDRLTTQVDRRAFPHLSKLPVITFKDIIGPVPSVVKKVARILKNPHMYLSEGLKDIPAKLLLYGPPGTGKTLLARAIAGETGRPFLSVSSGSLITAYQGSGSQSIKELFDEARRLGPCVLFIDELDGIADKMANSSSGESKRAVYQLFDQLEPNDPILFIGATNLERNILDALMSRFGEFSVLVPLPDKNTRKKLLLYFLDKNKSALAPEFFDILAEETEGLSIRQIHAMAMNALTRAIKRKTNSTTSNSNGSTKDEISFDTYTSENTVAASVLQDDLYTALYASQGCLIPKDETRKLILKFYLQKASMVLNNSFLLFFTKLTTGLSGKQLFDLVKKARSLAKEKNALQPREEDFVVAFYLFDEHHIDHRFRLNKVYKKNQIDFISRIHILKHYFELALKSSSYTVIFNGVTVQDFSQTSAFVLFLEKFNTELQDFDFKGLQKLIITVVDVAKAKNVSTIREKDFYTALAYCTLGLSKKIEFVQVHVDFINYLFLMTGSSLSDSFISDLTCMTFDCNNDELQSLVDLARETSFIRNRGIITEDNVYVALYKFYNTHSCVAYNVQGYTPNLGIGDSRDNKIKESLIKYILFSYSNTVSDECIQAFAKACKNEFGLTGKYVDDPYESNHMIEQKKSLLEEKIYSIIDSAFKKSKNNCLSDEELIQAAKDNKVIIFPTASYCSIM